MTCGACGARGTIENGRCSTCGADQRRYRALVQRERSQVPAIWQQAAPVIARGAALVAAGFIGEWLFRSAARKAVQVPFSRPRKPVPARKDDGLPKGTVAISETVVMRRVIVRR